MQQEQQMTEQESLQLIGQMLNKARNSFFDTGIGPILWGSVIAFCSLVTYGKIAFNWTLPFDVWLLTLVAIIPQVFIVIKESRIRKARNHDGATINYVWLCFGMAIFLFTHINIVFVNKLEEVYKQYYFAKGVWPAFSLNSYTSSIMLLLYGFPTIITGAIMKFKPMLWGGILGWVCCVISVYTSGKVDMLLTAFAASAMWLVPGIILWRSYQKKKAADV